MPICTTANCITTISNRFTASESVLSKANVLWTCTEYFCLIKSNPVPLNRLTSISPSDTPIVKNHSRAVCPHWKAQGFKESAKVSLCTHRGSCHPPLQMSAVKDTFFFFSESLHSIRMASPPSDPASCPAPLNTKADGVTDSDILLESLSLHWECFDSGNHLVGSNTVRGIHCQA